MLAAAGKHERKRSSYLKIYGEQKALIAKYAAENGIITGLVASHILQKTTLMVY